MSSGDTSDTTEHSEVILGTRCRVWCFTLNNPTESDVTHISDIFRLAGANYVFQEETSATGTEHLQGVVSYKNARTLKSMKTISPRIHWEPTKSLMASIKYCSKNDTRTGKIYSLGFRMPWVKKDPMTGLTWKFWQKQLLGILKRDPHPRKVMWYWSKEGGMGKTVFAKHLVISQDAMYVAGAGKDITYAVGKCEVFPRVVIWGVPRSSENYMSYGALESVKDGIFFASKYESKTVTGDVPHVVVFANFPPKLDEMSSDRWKVVQIDQPDTIWMNDWEEIHALEDHFQIA